MSHDIVWFASSESTTSRLRKFQHLGNRTGRSSSQIAAFSMTFRIAAEDELDQCFTILLFYDISHSKESMKLGDMAGFPAKAVAGTLIPLYRPDDCLGSRSRIISRTTWVSRRIVMTFSPTIEKWPHEGKPVGHTGTLLRDRDHKEVEQGAYRTFPSSWPRLNSSGAGAGTGSRAWVARLFVGEALATASDFG